MDDAERRFAALIEEFGRFLRNTILQKFPKRMGLDVDEIEQEARVRLWKAIQSERKIEDAASYIYRIAVTTTIDAIRRIKARKEQPLPAGEDPDVQENTEPVADPAGAPDRRAERKQLFRKLEAALSRLSPDRRDAVRLYLQGMNSAEIALLTGWSEPRARNLAYRGLEDLREELSKEGVSHDVR